MNFKEKLTDIFYKRNISISKTEPKTSVVTESIDFKKSVKTLLEAQYHSASAGITRSNQSSRQRQYYNDYRKYKKNFEKQLEEALDGIATPTGNQPKDLFNKLASAMDALGQRMQDNVPIQDKLKERGIDWKPSKDGTSLVFFIMNKATNAPQPIMTISSATLEKPHDFEEQLFAMLDFAEGKSPGTFKQEQEILRSREKAVREVAKSYTTPEPTQNQQLAGYNAATQAATPKV